MQEKASRICYWSFVFTCLCVLVLVLVLKIITPSPCPPRFCPTCNHKSLLSELGDKLGELDILLKKTEAERRRKERLAFVNASLNKALPTSPKKTATPKKVE